MKINRVGWLALVGLMGLSGCDDGGGTDAGPNDSGPGTDAGDFNPCPSDPAAVPAPEELMGACCWRSSNESQLDTPELRIAYLEVTAPVGSPLASMTVRRLLNESMQEERFNWLFRINTGGGDGPVSITTGYGRRAADGTYQFSQGMASSDPDAWCPVELTGSIAGETINTTPVAQAITVPLFDETGTMLQVELQLLNLSIENSTLSEMRSCIGSKTGRPYTYNPAATLVGYVDVLTARDQNLMVGTINTSVCAALAGSLDNPMYCDQDQSTWMVPPDSLCDASGCTTNAEGMTDVCDPTSSCNAWRFVADFAAAGVDISNDACN